MTATDDSTVTGESEKLTPVQTFYNGKSIFITGGSGFLGKVLIEKLLRSCPGVNTIYILLREKKGKSVEERIKELTSDIIFNELKRTDPNFAKRLVIIRGDCSQVGLGISEEDRKLLIENVNIVFHVAATVRFHEALKVAMALNVSATQYVIDLCFNIKNLESFCYVSTAYSFCCNKHVQEEVYDLTPYFDRAQKAVKELSDEEVDQQLNSILGNWPNTYTFTKAYAESLVKKAEGKLPICIFRPAIVASILSDPLPGWVDSYLGPTGIVIGAGCGIVRVLYCKKDITADIVPVDFVINGMLVACYEAGKNFRNDDKKLAVYNYVSSTDNALKFRNFEFYLKKCGITIPSTKAVWYYSLILCGNRSLSQILLILLHWMPALLIDTAAVLLGKQPVMIRLYKKVHKMLGALAFFTTTPFRFDTYNVRSLWNRTSEDDKKLFNFDIKSVDWEQYLSNYVKGARIHVLKEDMSTLTDARKKWNRLYWYHQIVKSVFFVLGLCIIWLLIKKVFYTIWWLV
ncbi:UNVERIFIED_CONTAM: hypothetical protein PYX00_002266 [Menopon gallinae]